MGLKSRIGGWFNRDWPTMSLDSAAQMFYGGFGYPLMQGGGTLSQKEERPEASFEGYVRAAYQSNGVIFACMLARLLLFAEARFQFRQLKNGRPGDLFGTSELALLESPWPNGTTGDLLTRMLQDADLAGNFYARRTGDQRIERLRPDWMTIVLGSDRDPGDFSGTIDPAAELFGYAYTPGGVRSGNEPIPLLPEEVAHFAPIPDPLARYRGMSWLDPIINELMADQAMTKHRLKFFEQGATPNMFVALDNVASPEQFDEWVTKYRSQTEGMQQAYKTMYMAAGHSPTVVGANLRQIDFKSVQGAGETRIAAAAGTPPVIVGLSEGLAAATYSNYGQARRRFADMTMRPLWRNAAGSLATLVRVPTGAELWYDDRDIPALQEDRKDAAEIQGTQATTIATLVREGFEPQSVIDAVTAEDFERLKHSGLVSVQLNPPGSSNGSKPGEQLALPTAE